MARSSNIRVEFAENPEPRCPCVLLLDTSGSMKGEKIEALNAGLVTLKASLLRDKLAVKRVELAIITFNSNVKLVHDFVTVDNFIPPVLSAEGYTAMGSGLQLALDTIQQRKEIYKTHGMTYYRPWVLMITDGEPRGEAEGTMQLAILRLNQEEQNRRVTFFSVGVDGANMLMLSALSARPPLHLNGMRFNEIFVWLSASMASVAHRQVNDQIALPPSGWRSA